MWRFIKALFKKKKFEPELVFNYDEETEVIVTRSNTSDTDEYDIEINTTRDLTDDDFIKIMSEVRERIDYQSMSE